MAPMEFEAALRDDNLDARYERVRRKLLHGIEETLDELALPGSQRAAIESAVWAHLAPLLCRQAICRRAKNCRRHPCTVPGAALRRSG